MKKYYIPQTIALLLLLIVLPVGSWFYLKSGLNYRKEAFSHLGNFGKLSDLTFTDLEGKKFLSDTNHIVLVNLFKIDSISFNNLKKITKAYEQRNDFTGVNLTCDTTYRFPYEKSLKSLYADRHSCEKLEGIQNSISSHVGHPINTIIINSKGVIVNGYDVNLKSDMAEMIKHISIILPGNKKVDTASVKRTKEK